MALERVNCLQTAGAVDQVNRNARKNGFKNGAVVIKALPKLTEIDYLSSGCFDFPRQTSRPKDNKYSQQGFQGHFRSSSKQQPPASIPLFSILKS
jgi:hypothetical protein